MNAVTIIASPRKNGNCKQIVDILTSRIKDENGENNVYFIDDLNIKGCMACKRCKDMDNPTRCIIDDDFNMIMDMIDECDLFIFACPNYFGEINAQGHLFMDRFYSMTKTTPNQLDYTTKAIVIHTYGAKMGHYDEYINKRSRLFNSIGLDVVDVISVGENRPSTGSCDELLRKSLEIISSIK